MINNIYLIIDFYENVDGQPLVLILLCRKEVNRIVLPKFCKILGEFTDKEEYNLSNMANVDYKMPEQHKTLTAIDSPAYDDPNLLMDVK